MEKNQFQFRVLFCFENESQLLIEIKRTDIQSEDKSLVYKWLSIQKENEKQNENEKQSGKEELIRQLTFRSMEQADGKQTRNFAEGTLIWNADTASFNNEAMTQIEPEEVSTEWLAVIADFLELTA